MVNNFLGGKRAVVLGFGLDAPTHVLLAHAVEDDGETEETVPIGRPKKATVFTACLADQLIGPAEICLDVCRPFPHHSIVLVAVIGQLMTLAENVPGNVGMGFDFVAIDKKDGWYLQLCQQLQQGRGEVGRGAIVKGEAEHGILLVDMRQGG